MKILRLTAENVKRLTVVDIEADPHFNELTGKNKSGKTSLIDSILWALGGEKVIQDDPVHHGAKQLRIRLDMGELIVERTRSVDGAGGLTVRSRPAGTDPSTPDKKLPKWSSPQEMLDGLIGAISFDPLAFARKKQREQYDSLRRIAKIEVDIDALEAANEADFKRRTDVNRRGKDLRAQAAGFTFTLPAIESRADVSALIADMESATRLNGDIDRRADRRTAAETAIADGKEELRRLEASRGPKVSKLDADLAASIARLRKAYDDAVAGIDSAITEKRSAVAELSEKLAKAEPLPEKIDVAPLRGKIDEAQVLNREFDRRQEQSALIQRAEAAESESAAITKAISGRDAEKLAAIQSAQMPIAGLSLGGGRVLYGGVPFDQCSDAEQLRISVEIAMAENAGDRRIRVVRIREGSLLDDDGMKMIVEMAKRRDYQVWIETVRSDNPMAIVMEDGTVASHGKAPETKEAVR